MPATALKEASERLAQARHHDPFQVLGCHPLPGDASLVTFRVFLPYAKSISITGVNATLTLTRETKDGLWCWKGEKAALPPHPELEWKDTEGCTYTERTPYTFAPQVGELDLHLFGEGRHWQVQDVLGAHCKTVDGVEGVLFATWAPAAERVSVIGDFNLWDERRHPMRVLGGSGVWELFVPGLSPDNLYKFSVRNRESGQVQSKADPYGRAFEIRPQTAARVVPPTRYRWGDADWLEQRATWDWQAAPMSVYELHLSSWQKTQEGGFMNYRDLAHQIADYVRPLGFTHIELLPITEHPLDDSWGYQTTGYYAPTSRFGSPDDFRYFVDYLHQAGVGVLLDWVPAHFPKDEHALARYDGTALYEHEDPRRGEHRDWGTLIYNYGRNEVRNFLLANALYWLKEFHIDGLRVDAVASMLYLDYSREEGDWLPNRYGGNENLEAIDFLRQLNELCHGEHPGSLVMAEESTAWPQVTRPTWVGGLGFSMKWNMGWMHDTLVYMSKDPIYRHYHHDQLTFGLVYAFTENFMLPFSHDEVVHGKGSLLGKMPGDDWQKFANLRLLYSYQWTYPGNKLLFMGSEFAQRKEWAYREPLDWGLLDHAPHRGILSTVTDLNHLYRNRTELHQRGFRPEGFEWIDCHDSTQSIISYLRSSEDGFLVVVLNFTPTPREGYRLGVPSAGEYREIFNSDSTYYGGSNLGNPLPIPAEASPWMNRPYSIQVTLPPLGAIILECHAL
ncbi:1,4-alpha-glucan branching protein GlgB [Marinimicrobium locisalis]|uniref:1,4-alpha-glucan branching protein GlgB n=1 Tax=Marinimicrobium locisalis TaxID=546022 RepID=UPI003221967D